MNLQQWLDYIERQHPKSIDMGLERVREVAARMGLERPAPCVITVAGTNGKGSTVAFVEAIASAAGWQVGTYTSPHLLAYNERVRIGGAQAADADLVAAFEAVELARSGNPSPARTASDAAATEGVVPLTYFEYGTLAALWLFERAGLDLAVLEVGLGGRLDATNLVDADVAVITTVDLDHQDWLGPDREAIGFEKAGIARAWKPLVLGDDDPPSSVLRHAYAIGAPALRIGCDFFFDPPAAGAGRSARWQWREVGCELDLPLPALAAPVQLRNAAVAIAALRALPLPGRALPDETAIARGIEAAQLSGRLQRCVRDGVEVLVDVGHNPQAARELAAWLRAAPVAGRTFAVYAALDDKDARGVVAALADSVAQWHLAGLPVQPRGQPVESLAERLAGTAAGGGARHAAPVPALQAALQQARAGDRVLVFGSFHTAAAALAWLADGAPAPG